ncbi:MULTISPECIES: DUF3426 domain-containing protein [Gammaproteobacteria]|uniref:DUF3426 domain-containing protein n=1 Tax=Gammaproteobacteria TaxID=1236 RepID=UPI001ADD14A2|nr:MULTISPECIES: DUF3426 domain-containing protein [Gammaproteobacteria]MBO9480138.1 DUF3426 domain-containing protein [Salinisphaera sp. G21_0]MBO9493271.1 DUF3426 domain-containing protein [Thalassotalea sp. G20_0]
MTPSSVTCPHCQTIFRITHAQLKAARGSVRCGSCLQVFNAIDQLPRLKEQEKEAFNTSIENVETSSSDHREEPQTPTQTQKKLRETLVVQQQKPVKKPDSTQPETSRSKDLDPSIKAKVATAPIQYDGYHQQSIETLIHELDQRETEETINEQQLRRKRTYWGVAACCLLVLLTLQFAWFNRNTLSLSPALRPAYTMTCNLLSCKLPPMVNLNAIKSVDLVVRSHPEQDNALQVDAVIINEARHPQPFPDLKLTFTDINGRLVANRTFTPSEYLGGELAGSDEMPKAQPIRLGLEIVDPGEQAVNYQLTFSEN